MGIALRSDSFSLRFLSSNLFPGVLSNQTANFWPNLNFSAGSGAPTTSAASCPSSARTTPAISPERIWSSPEVFRRDFDFVFWWSFELFRLFRWHDLRPNFYKTYVARILNRQVLSVLFSLLRVRGMFVCNKFKLIESKFISYKLYRFSGNNFK